MLESLKEAVCAANCRLPEYGLVVFTWGNVSGIDREKGLFVIKPSGVEYDRLRPEDMVVVDLEGHVVEGKLNPSSDTPTHAALYRRFPEIGGIVHTHSRWATSWAQAGREIPAYGTTHADYMYGPIPCTRLLTKEEVDRAYELETGNVIVECFEQKHLSPVSMPCVLVNGHAPFVWGKDCNAAVYNAAVLEEVAMMAVQTEQLTRNPHQVVPQYVLDKHYNRKHGPGAYYGQK